MVPGTGGLHAGPYHRRRAECTCCRHGCLFLRLFKSLQTGYKYWDSQHGWIDSELAVQWNKVRRRWIFACVSGTACIYRHGIYACALVLQEGTSMKRKPPEPAGPPPKSKARRCAVFVRLRSCIACKISTRRLAQGGPGCKLRRPGQTLRVACVTLSGNYGVSES